MSYIRNPIHSHILFLRNLSQHFQTYLQENQFNYNVVFACDFCGNNMMGSTSIYCCELCRFYIHTSCAAPPLLQIQHCCHGHPLDLQVPDEENEFSYYRCVEFDSGCDFKLYASDAMETLWVEKYYCSMLREANDEEYRLQFAHEHLLTTFPAKRMSFCGGCKMEISEEEEAYGCRECNFFLHEACAKAPPVVENHPFHPEHCLHLRCCPGANLFDEAEDLACLACGTESSIGYSCEECRFFLDMSCARATITKWSSVMDHYLHQHQLSSYNSKTQTMIVCSICEDQIPSGNFLGCSDCSFFLHESCAQPQPIEIQHYLHLEHTLTFAQLTSEKHPECLNCGYRVRSDFYCYTCQMCDLFIHRTCASATLSDLKKETSITVQYPFHENELNLFHQNNGCQTCRFCEETAGGRTTSRCFSQGCIFNLYKLFVQLPSKLEHPSHLLHPLTLSSKPHNEDIVCRQCSTRIGDPLAFSCGECDFHLHHHCARKPTLKHPFHEHNLLYFVVTLKTSTSKEDKSGIFDCRACLKSCSLDFFRCAECDYTLHYECSQLLPTINYERHIDPLVLRESVIEDDSGEYYCDICERRRDPMKWVYFCETCELTAHVDCALSQMKLEVVEEDDFICRKEDIQKQEEEIKRAQEQADAKEASLRPLMVELESMRAKLESQSGALEELKSEHAKWIDMEAIKKVSLEEEKKTVI